MKVKFIRRYGNYDRGDIVDYGAKIGVAKTLVVMNFCVEVKDEPVVEPKTSESDKRSGSKSGRSKSSSPRKRNSTK